MAFSITNISSEEITYAQLIKDNKMKLCMKLANSYKNLLPQGKKYKIRITINNSNAAFANMIRRCLIGELPIKALDFDEFEDFESSDKYILNDYIKRQIELIPVHQSIKLNEVFSLYKENHTDDLVDIKSGDIVNDGGKKYFDDNIVLCRLRPGMYVKIDNIKIVQDNTNKNYAKFASISNSYFKILDQVPYDEYTEKGQSSLIYEPGKFELGYTTYRNIDDPFYFIKLCIDVLLKRLELLIEEIEFIDEEEKSYYSDFIELLHFENYVEIILKEEYITIPRVIVNYIYNLTKGDIKYVSSSIEHPEKNLGKIRIAHPQYIELINKALNNIIKDLHVFKSMLK